MTAADVASTSPVRPPRVRVYHRLPSLRRNQFAVWEEIGRQHEGRLVRLDLGLFKPYLVTQPDQVQHVFQRADIYTRSEMLWRSLERLQGNGIVSEGPEWELSRRLLQPSFTGKAIAGLMTGTAEAINGSIDDLAQRVGAGGTVDVAEEMIRITHRVLSRVFLGDRIPVVEADAVGREVSNAFASLGSRMMLPFVSHRVPMPGDRRFNRAVQIIDSTLLPYIKQARTEKPRADLVSILAHAKDDEGKPLTDKRVRDDVVSMFIGGTETTALTLTWTWIMRDLHPDVAARLDEEAHEVVGDGPVTAEHLGRLIYTKSVMEEVLRLYPAGWMLPRFLHEPDVLGGVPLKAGTTVILSPYLTHRIPQLWPEPERFDPDRFTAERKERRHPYAYYPFGGGMHRCLGSHFFTIESALAAAALFRRFQSRLRATHPVIARGITLRPKDPVLVELRPRQPRAAR
jgi:cytochrome P450